MRDPPAFYICGLRPVKYVRAKDGGLLVLKMNWETGVFEYGLEYLARTLSSDADVDEVSEDEFIQHVESLRADRLEGEGTVYALYQLIREMDARVKGGVKLGPEDKALLRQLRVQTYALFQEEHPDPEY